MNRVIKFRAFSRIFNEHEMFYDVGIVNKKDGQWFSFNNGSRLYQSGNRVNIMQFTGLHDKNGKEIYEEDILKHRLGNLVVYWHDKLLKFVVDIPIIGGDTSPCDLFQFYDLECIGNIYENPNLLP